MSNTNTRISTLALCQVNRLFSEWLYLNSFEVDKIFFTIFTTVVVQVVRNYMNFITCQKS